MSIYCSSEIDDISRRVQELVEKINDSRISDQKVLDSFQEKLVEKVQNLFYASGPILYFVHCYIHQAKYIYQISTSCLKVKSYQCPQMF